eukprot:CAMPEP_0184499542 /NCGR_PEP_ID=MMETSP0113_2-20130426/41748_1 /TAXON_ID=91329 /ORGANISM="Norrisiella sphaerica, Strain BC52" /LENGTH=299 /DNA_ID=CAMNT_0026887473 /DNA_START=60 /DNA_END=959 /DNA_ORIENTATION=-
MSYRGEQVVNLYALLEIQYDAAAKEIRKAYRKMSLKWHPDKNPNNKEFASQKFDEITKAYEVLTDEKQKKEYDAKLQVAREREAKWEAANAEIRSMREKLEKRERDADNNRLKKRRKTEEDEISKKNKERIKEMMKEIELEEAEKEIRRASTFSTTRSASGLSKESGTIKVKWRKGDKHTKESLSAIFERYGTIASLTMKQRAATITYYKRRSAEDCLLKEISNPALKIKMVRDESTDTKLAKGEPSRSEGAKSNPFAFSMADLKSNGNSAQANEAQTGIPENFTNYEDDVLARMLGKQ